jgi:hypothetical protein
MAHFLYVFYVGLDGGEEGFEFGAGAKAFEMAFFGVPFDAQDVMVWSFGAAGQFVGQAMGGGGERFYGFLVGHLEGAPSWFVDLVPRVFHNHDGSWVRYGNLRETFSPSEKLALRDDGPTALSFFLQVLLMQLRSCELFLTCASGRVQ